MIISDHPDQPKLTKNQNLVWRALREATFPKSAYTLLDDLRGHGLRAPLQVYRALDGLQKLGFVHRIESMNAFVACQEPQCCGDQATAFAICDKCGHVDEIMDQMLAQRLERLARDAGFAVSTSTVEVKGCCRQCQPTG